MNRFFLLLILIFLNFASEASRRQLKDGYFVDTNSDTVFVKFKNVNYHAMSLRSIKNGIWYTDANRKQIYLKADDAKFVRIIDSVNGNMDIYSIRRKRSNIFVARLLKGRLSLFISHKSNAPMASIIAAAIMNKYAATSQTIYYFTLDGGPARSNAAQAFTYSFWKEYLKDYPDFIECINWGRKKSKANRKLGVDCHFRTKNLSELAQMFNEKYPE